MMDPIYTVTTTYKLRELCIKHNWFTCGSCEQYDKMFYANENGYSLEEIATIIWLCSEKRWTKSEIYDILLTEKNRYLNLGEC